MKNYITVWLGPFMASLWISASGCMMRGSRTMNFLIIRLWVFLVFTAVVSMGCVGTERFRGVFAGDLVCQTAIDLSGANSDPWLKWMDGKMVCVFWMAKSGERQVVFDIANGVAIPGDRPMIENRVEMKYDLGPAGRVTVRKWKRGEMIVECKPGEVGRIRDALGREVASFDYVPDMTGLGDFAADEYAVSDSGDEVAISNLFDMRLVRLSWNGRTYGNLRLVGTRRDVGINSVSGGEWIRTKLHFTTGGHLASVAVRQELGLSSNAIAQVIDGMTGVQLCAVVDPKVRDIDMSPDGTMVAYMLDNKLVVRRYTGPMVDLRVNSERTVATPASPP